MTQGKVPSVQRIVYSTCSVHAMENEGVVRQACATQVAHKGRFILAGRNDVLPTWPRRGLTSELASDGKLTCRLLDFTLITLNIQQTASFDVFRLRMQPTAFLCHYSLGNLLFRET